jgi:hypothetical protein
MSCGRSASAPGTSLTSAAERFDMVHLSRHPLRVAD